MHVPILKVEKEIRLNIYLQFTQKLLNKESLCVCVSRCEILNNYTNRKWGLEKVSKEFFNEVIMIKISHYISQFLKIIFSLFF